MPNSTKPSGALLRLVPALRLLGGALYGIFKLFPLRDRLVMMTRRKVTRSIDFDMLRAHVLAEHPGINVVELHHPMDNKFQYVFMLLKELWYLATSRWVIVDGYQISVSLFPHRSGTKVVQIWHALGAIKQFGHMTIGKEAGASTAVASTMQMHQNYDAICAPSQATAEVFARAFDAPLSRIKAVGSPRIDYLVGLDQGRIRQRVIRKYHLDPKRPVYLYAPTFRDGYAIPVADLAAAATHANVQLILHVHPRDLTTVPAGPGLVVSTESDILTVLPGVDGVITDYSAVVFEAGILHLPVALWDFDLDSYSESPGFTLDYQGELGDLRANSPAEAIDLLQWKRSANSEQFTAFMHRYVQTWDNQNCARIGALLGIPEGTPR